MSYHVQNKEKSPVKITKWMVKYGNSETTLLSSAVHAIIFSNIWPKTSTTFTPHAAFIYSEIQPKRYIYWELYPIYPFYILEVPVVALCTACALHIFLTVRRIQVKSRGREVGKRCPPSFLHYLIRTNFCRDLISGIWNTNISRALIFAISQKMINLRHLISLKLTRDRLKKPFFFELLSCYLNLNTLSQGTILAACTRVHSL